MPDIPDGFGHLISPYEYLAWLIQAALDWTKYGEASPAAGAGAWVINYTVTKGKTLLVTEISIAAEDSAAQFYTYLTDYTSNKIRFTMGGKSGLHETFPQTILIPSEHNLRVSVLNLETTAQTFACAVNGYLI